MKVWGKLIGAGLGFILLHGPLGAAVGLIIGHWLDVKFGKPRNGTAARAAERQQIFTASVVNLAAKLAKSDGPVSRGEVDAFKAQFSIPQSQMSAIATLWEQAKADPAGYEPHARRLAGAFADTPHLLNDVLLALNRIALADGVLHPAERAFLSHVAEIFGLGERPFAAQASELKSEDPYAVLAVSRAAAMPDIKAAWRKLTREHHPDTLMAKGMPQEYIDLATRKMAEINAAYDRIRTERGES